MRMVLLLAIAWLSAAPARADVTATYKAPQGILVVEVTHSGEARVSGQGPIYQLMTPAGDYVVFGREQLVAARLEDFKAAQASVQPGVDPVKIERQLRELIELRRRFAGEVAPGQPDDTPRYVPRGTKKVAGISGTRYEMSARHLRELLPDIVVSSAPELRRLGEVVAEFFAPTAVDRAGPGASTDTYADVLRTGAMLKIGKTVELTKLSFDPVPVERFAVPSKRLSRDELIVLISLTAPSPKAEK